MNRFDAIAILSARLADAPNYADYTAWLSRQPDEILIALAEGCQVHAFPRQQAA